MGKDPSFEYGTGLCAFPKIQSSEPTIYCVLYGAVLMFGGIAESACKYEPCSDGEMAA